MIFTVHLFKDYSPQKSETTKEMFLKMINKKGYKFQLLHLWEFPFLMLKLFRHWGYGNFNLTEN